MRKLFFITTLFFFSLPSIGQENRIRLDNGKPGSTGEQPLFLVNGQAVTMNAVILNPNHIQSINIQKTDSVLALYGSLAKFGLVDIQLVPGLNLVPVAALMDHFGIKAEDRLLKICIDNTPVADASKLLADLDFIKEIKLVTVVPDALFLTCEDRYLNIVTKK
jgi:hypothetical protein